MSFYITTPIYYVNGRPHIGHAYTTIAADTITRYTRMKGENAFFMTGTDEHGQKVLEAAEARGMDPKAHCDDMVVSWKQMMSEMDIGFDRFIRTTDPDHQALVVAVLSKLWDQELIYKDSYTGWYSTAAERFWTEKDLVDGKCPDSGQPVEKITETNYFFKMGQYRDELVAHIEQNPGFIQPESRRNEVLGFLRKDLGDLCISRPKSRMSWGIELPFDSEFVTYVWFDALLNYLTGAGYHPDGDDSYLDRWPADFHVLGKDILTTHAVYWCTMLLAMEVPLPTCIYAHGWWTATDGSKMSKSLGNAIDVSLLANEFGVDPTRFFFLREIRFGADGGFSYDGFLTRYNADLANDLGNMVHRGLSMTRNWLGGTVPEWGPLNEADEALRSLAARAVVDFDRHLVGMHFSAALEALWELVRAGNKYIDEQQPWALNKAGNTERLATVLRHVLEISFFAGTLLACVMPSRSADLLQRLGRSPEAGADWLRYTLGGSTDQVLNALPAGLALTVGDPLFPRFREMPEGIAKLLETAEPAPKKKKDKKKAPKAAAKSAASEPISFEDFQKVQLCTGRILEVADHPNAERLFVLKVDIGEEAPRQIVAGIKSRYSADELVGRTCVVVANLKPAKLRGVESQGMLLAAGAKEVVDLVSVGADPGTIVR